MTFDFTIDGVAKTLQSDWRVSEVLNGRNVMTFNVESLDGTYRPADRAVVAFEIDGDVYFGGTIHAKDESGIGGYGVQSINTYVGATDFNALPDRRQVALTIPAGHTLKQGLALVTAYLAGYSVTLDAGQVDGPTFATPLVFEFGPLTDILNKLSVITGYAWNISYSRVLSMFEPGATSAPFNIANDDGTVIGDITVSPSLSEFANQVIVRFTSSAVAAYAFLATTGNFSDTETVTVGGKTYTFQATLTDVDGNVQIGGDAEASLNHLAAAITLGGTPGTDYAASMTVNGSVSAYLQNASTLKAVALNVGAAGNSIACGDTAATAAWITEGGGGTSTLLFGADDALTNYVTATSSPDPADLVELSFSHPEIRDTATAQAMADGYLVRTLVTPRTVKYTTFTPGLHPGMQQHITASWRNLNGDCLITAVDTTAIGEVLMFEVTAVEGLVIVPSDMDMYKGWSSGSSTSSIAVSVGGGTTTVLSAPFDLGGTDAASVPMPGPAYTAVSPAKRFIARASFTGLVTVWLWARAGGVTVTARLQNLTDATTVGTSSGITASSRPSTPTTFNVPVVAGKEYELQVISSTANQSVYGMGQLEAA